MAESQVLDGVMLQKDVLHSKMRRRIENPRILLLDCPLEYKKVVKRLFSWSERSQNESQTSFDVKNPDAWTFVVPSLYLLMELLEKC